MGLYVVSPYLGRALAHGKMFRCAYPFQLLVEMVQPATALPHSGQTSDLSAP